MHMSLSPVTRTRLALRPKHVAWLSVGTLTAVFSLIPPARSFALGLLHIPDKPAVERIVGDSLRADRAADRLWRDSVSDQLQAIRCAVDSVEAKSRLCRMGVP